MEKMGNEFPSINKRKFKEQPLQAQREQIGGAVTSLKARFKTHVEKEVTNVAKVKKETEEKDAENARLRALQDRNNAYLQTKLKQQETLAEVKNLEIETLDKEANR